MRPFSVILAALVALCAGLPAAAAPARVVTVQGAVLTSGGTPAEGTFAMTFRLFADETGGAALYTQAEPGVVVAGGLFDEELGPLPVGLLEGADALWLEAQVGTEVLPRRPLRTVPWALVAQVATSLECAGCVSSGAVSFPWAASASKGGPAADLACTGCVSATELASGAIATVHLQDGVVSGAKAGFNYAASASKGGPASDLSCSGCVAGSEIVASPALAGNVSASGSLTACTAGAPGCGLELPDSALVEHGDGWLSVQVASGVRVRDQANGAWLPVESGGGTAFGNLGVTGSLGVGTTSPSARLHVAGSDTGVTSALKLNNAADVAGARTRLTFSTMANGAATLEIDAVRVAQGSAATAMTVRTHTGSAWNDSQLVLAQTGSVGVGVASPAARLDVAGGVRVADHAASCTSGLAGTIRWNGAHFQGCNGAKWINLDTGSGLGSAPGTPGQSCNAIKKEDPSVEDGVYWIDPNGGSSSDAFQIWCDMTTDGGGWTLVSKANGTTNDHIGTTAKNLANLKDTQVSQAGYIGDEARVALGRCYRVTSTTDGVTRYAIVNNQLSFNEWWGNPNPGVLWRDTYSTSSGDYTTIAGDDAGSAGHSVAIAYGGRNWARPNGYTGSGLYGGGYGKSGLMYVKDCLGTSGLGASKANAGASCLAILNAGASTGDGSYWIDPNGGSTSDAMLAWCDMTSNGGGWTLVAKSNGADNLHVGSGFTGNAASLATLDLSTSVYIGDAARLALGKCYRVTDATDGITRYAYVTNTLSFNEWWGNPNTGVGWSDSYSTSSGSYSTGAGDDVGSPGYTVAIAYGGRNWARPNGYVGSGLFYTGGVYGKKGVILVKACIP